MSTTRYVFATYCDDIRQEVGGKISLIGCYSSDLVVRRQADGQPVLLPKLCAQVHAVTAIEHPFQRLTFRAFNGDDQLGELEIPEERLRDIGPPVPDAKFHMISAILNFVPFLVPEAGGKLRMLVETEEEVLNAPSLRLVYAPVAGVAPVLADTKTIQ